MSETASPCHEARRVARELEAEAIKLAGHATRLVWVQDVFADASNNARAPTNSFAELRTVSSELALTRELWDAVCTAEDYLSARASTTLRDIDVDELKGMVERMGQVVQRLRQSPSPMPALERLEDAKSVIEGLAPVVRDLRNANLEERHWAKLEDKLQCSFSLVVRTEHEPREARHLDLPLSHLLEIRAVSRATTIHQVAEEATAEAAVVKAFESVVHTWEEKEIPVLPKKDRDGRDAHCLDDCEELSALLEESEVLLRVMDFSSYARTIQTRLTRLLSDLSLAKSALELLQICQQKWEQLQRLVSADFTRAFPEQATLLQTHDAAWRALMETLAKRPLCVPFAVGADNRHVLQVILEGFEAVAKSLGDHLEVRRRVCVCDGGGGIRSC